MSTNGFLFVKASFIKRIIIDRGSNRRFIKLDIFYSQKSDLFEDPKTYMTVYLSESFIKTFWSSVVILSSTFVLQYYFRIRFSNCDFNGSLKSLPPLLTSASLSPS